MPQLELSKQQETTVSEALRFLDANGYCVLRGVVPSEACSNAKAAFLDWTHKHATECHEKRGSDGRLPRITNLHIEYPQLSELFVLPVLLEVQDRFFRREAVLYQRLYYEHGSTQAFHRDAHYFAPLPRYESFLGVWYALEDADEQNGALCVIPGGYRVRVDTYAIARRHFPNRSEVPPIVTGLWSD